MQLIIRLVSSPMINYLISLLELVWGNNRKAKAKANRVAKAQWLDGRMPDYRSREPGQESPHIMASLMATRYGSGTPQQKQNPFTVLDTWQSTVIY